MKINVSLLERMKKDTKKKTDILHRNLNRIYCKKINPNDEVLSEKNEKNEIYNMIDSTLWDIAVLYDDVYNLLEDIKVYENKLGYIPASFLETYNEIIENYKTCCIQMNIVKQDYKRYKKAC